MSCKDFVFTCELVNGIHARPATLLVKVAETFQSRIELENTRNGNKANVKSVLSLLSADIACNDVCRVRLTGHDAGMAMKQLRHYILRELSHTDQPVSTVESVSALPPSLRSLPLKACRGIATGSGWVRGQPFVLKTHTNLSSIQEQNNVVSNGEKQRLRNALERLDIKFDELIKQASLEAERDIFKAQQSLAQDREFRDYLSSVINKGLTVANSLESALQYFSSRFEQLENPYLRGRTIDIQDICDRIFQLAYNLDVKEETKNNYRGKICFSDTLSPSQFLKLAEQGIKGVVLESGGKTSHTVLLALAKNIPVIVGAEGACQLIELSQDVIVDSQLGLVITDPSEKVERYYRQEEVKASALAKRSGPYIRRLAETSDGCRVEIGANIINQEEAQKAISAGAEGIGLFRTEMMFMAIHKAPSIAEQQAVYRAVFAAAGDKPVIIRTVDIGADKTVNYLDLPEESNPFLGYRAVRLYPEFYELFHNQVSAILEASVGRRVNLMIPMVSTVSEVIWVREQIDKIHSQLGQRGIKAGEVRLGMMLEVPSACLIIDQLARYIDFFSIGSNDLTQYILAADRGNKKLERLYHFHHPAFLRFLKKVVSDAQKHERWIGLCGEMAADPQALPLLVGLGLNEISVPVSVLPAIKEKLSQLDSSKCKALLEQALNCEHGDEVSQLLQQFTSASLEKSPFNSNIIEIDVDCLSKEEAIKALVDMLYLDNRIADPVQIEEAIWQREQQCSTGLGNGIATPHCQSNLVLNHSVAVLRFGTPVEWNALDGQPVTTVFLLVAREDGAKREHMELFASLARKLVNEDFVSKIHQCLTSDSLASLLDSEL